MATSGQATYTYTLADLLDQACLKAGAETSTLTDEQINTAVRETNFWLTSLSDLSLNLWCLEDTLMGLYYGQIRYPLPPGTLDVTNINMRKVSRLLGGSPSSSAGGNPASAFDGDLTTACTQTAPLGNIEYDYFTATLVTGIGFMPNSSSTLGFVVEYSVDYGVTWLPALSVSSQAVSAGVWYWYDFDRAQTALSWRLRATVGTLDVTEWVIFNNPAEIPIARLNRDQYFYMPNQHNPGPYPLNYWLDRQRDAPEIVLWPSPNDPFVSMHLIRHRHVQAATTLNQEVEIPQRVYDAFQFGLAERLLLNGIGDMKRYDTISAKASSTMMIAKAEERDNSQAFYTPNIRAYTRG